MDRKIKFVLFVFLGFIIGGGLFFWYGRSKQQSQMTQPSTKYISVDELLGNIDKTQDTIDTFETLEATLHPYNDILKNNKYDKLIALIIGICPEGTLDAGEEFYDALYSYAVNVQKAQVMNPGTRLLLTAEKFRSYISESKQLIDENLGEYCSKKYGYLRYEKVLQEVHAGFLVNSGIYKELQEGDTKSFQYGIQEKTDLLEYALSRDKSIVASISPLLTQGGIRISNQKMNILSKNPRYNDDITKLLIESARTKILKNLGLLLEEKVLTIDHLKALGSNITIKIPDNCELTQANYIYTNFGVGNDPQTWETYRAKQDYGSVNTITHRLDIFGSIQNEQIQFQGLEFHLPICPSYENIVNFTMNFDYTILHEIGHYYADFIDPDSRRFYSLCWSGDGKSECKPGDFVSEYASTAPEEDYAESWAAYIHDLLYPFKRYVHNPTFKEGYFERIINSNI